MDIKGAVLGPDCVLVRYTPEGYRCVSQDEAAKIQALVIGRTDDPDWLFRQCHRIVKALAEQNLALAQIYGLSIPIVELNDSQLQRLASTAQIIKANFNPDQTRDARGRWTDQGIPGTEVPSASEARGRWRGANDPLIGPGASDTAPTQLAADNQRENKMVRDIVVQLKLTRDQQQKLHRYISGQGYSYREVLEIAKDLFGK